MATRRFKKLVQLSALSSMFVAGFLCGTLAQQPADAQMGDIMKKVGESGGSVGSAAQLGSSIIEMQEHVNGLQKNLDTLNKIKSALGG